MVQPDLLMQWVAAQMPHLTHVSRSWQHKYINLDDYYRGTLHYLSQDPLSEEPSHKRVPSTISVHNVRTGEGSHGVAPHLPMLHGNDWT